MKLKYNKDEYFRLLKYYKKLKEQGKKLMKEDPYNYYLLLDYQVLLENRMMDFLNESIIKIIYFMIFID